jgi:hypothetical protein
MTRSTLPRFACFALACAAVVYAASATDDTRAAAAPVMTSAEDVAQAPVQAATDPSVRRSRYVGIDFSTLRTPSQRQMLREPSITLELFPDVTVFAAFDRYDPNPDGVTWVGHVEGVPMSNVTLVYRDAMMTGSVVMPNAVFQIRPAPAEVRNAAGPGRVVHLVSQIDQDALPREAPPIEVSLTAAQLAEAADAPMADTADVIDVMVVYTPLAAASVGGATALSDLIDLSVSETNTSYANSGINQRIRLVHTAQVPYTEVSNFGVNLSGLRAGVGGLSGVAALRDTHGADMVQLLVHPPSPSACGIAYLMTSVSTAFAPNAYSVTDTSCLSPNYTFAHELGHNMGARHDWYMDSSTTPYTYAHGYVNPAIGQRWRTIMSYPDMCNALGFTCTRLLNWANPDKRYLPGCDSGRFNCNQLQYWFYPGAPMGIPGGTDTSCPSGNPNNAACDADDRRALNNTALSVANLRQAVK